VSNFESAAVSEEFIPLDCPNLSRAVVFSPVYFLAPLQYLVDGCLPCLGPSVALFRNVLSDLSLQVGEPGFYWFTWTSTVPWLWPIQPPTSWRKHVLPPPPPTGRRTLSPLSHASQIPACSTLFSRRYRTFWGRCEITRTLTPCAEMIGYPRTILSTPLPGQLRVPTLACNPDGFPFRLTGISATTLLFVIGDPLQVASSPMLCYQYSSPGWLGGPFIFQNGQFSPNSVCFLL